MPNRVPLSFESLPGANLEFEASGVLSGFKLFADGKQVKKKKGSFSIPRPDGSAAELKGEARPRYGEPNLRARR